MFRFFLIGAAAIGLAWPADAKPADGELLSSSPCVRHALSYEDYAAATRKAYDSEAALGAKAGIPQPPVSTLPAVMYTRTEYEAMAAHPYGCRAIFYGSDGLKVAAYVWEPAKTPAGARLPVVVALRGGNQDFGKFTADSHGAIPALVGAGFVVVGVQYRGVDGGEGMEQFGGDDVHDVLNAIALARRLPEADPRNVFLLGTSRGGLMVYLAERDGAKVNAAAAVSAMTDLALEAKRRPAMVANVWRKLIPNYDANPAEALARRSGLKVAQTVDLPPMLILHGTADWRVDPGESIAIAQALQARGRPYSLHIFNNDVHGVLWNWREQDRLLVDWFRQHMVH
ncbi:MAG TPA: prolyl oligopeptidase family serine peptidase [Allosphingosinicella sp.]|jgi:dipeptidyl aminopeptidase/acylaminoacyl peptidase|nr:prolyl oligopeptidase family serine peptidase [Allosphingosinicella sp.]